MSRASIACLAVAGLGIVVGLGWRTLRPLESAAAYSIMGVGGAALLAFLWLERKEIAGLASGRSARYGGNALAYSLIVIALVFVANWVAVQHKKTFDLTEDKLFTLTEPTLKILSGLTRDVDVAFVPSGDPSDATVEDVLKLYQQSSPRVKVAIVDPMKEPRKVEQLGVRALGTIALSSGTQKTSITATGEEAITNAIHKVSTDKVVKAYFVEGQGERSPEEQSEHGLSYLKTLLGNKSLTVATCNLSTLSDVPRDASLLVIVDPQRPLGEHEISVLKKYLDEGGRALLMLDPTRDGGLTAFLAGYGIELHEDLVVEQGGAILQGTGPETIIVSEGYPFHPITDHFAYNTLYHVVRSVLPAEKPPATVTVKPLVQTTPQSYAERDLTAPEAGYTEGTDRKGPVPFAVAATWTPAAPPAAPPAESTNRSDGGRMVVIGDADWADNSILPVPQFANAPLLTNMVGWLSETEALISIPAKKTKGAHVVVSANAGIALVILAVIVIPGAFAVTGGLTWLRRRKL